MPSDYERGLSFGRTLREMREAGENPDPRFDIADEARSDSDFDEWMRGLTEGMSE